MKEETRKLLLDGLILLAVLAIFYYFVDAFFFLLLPFCFGLLFAGIVEKSFRRLRPIKRGAKKILIILILLIFFALISLCAVLIADWILDLFATLSAYLTEHSEAIGKSIQSTVKSAEDFFSSMLHRNLENSVSKNLPTVLRGLLQELLTKIPKWMGSLASSVPNFIVSLLIFLLSTYYFSCDWDRWIRWAKQHIPKERLEWINRFKKRFFRAGRQWLVAYLLLFLLTFSQLFLGLTLLKQNGVFAKSFLIAFVDLLPILGCGTVLLPWTLFCFFSGNLSLAVGLLVLYLVIFVIRQIAEPKLVGTSIGLHPILSLLLVLAGLRFFGFFGMILLPLVATCLIPEHT